MGLFDQSQSVNEQFNTTTYQDFDYTTSTQDSFNTNTSITKTVENSNNNTNNSKLYSDASSKLLDSLNSTVAPNIAIFGSPNSLSQVGAMGLDLSGFFSRSKTPSEISANRDTTGFFNSGQLAKIAEADSVAPPGPNDLKKTAMIVIAVIVVALALLKFNR